MPRIHFLSGKVMDITMHEYTKIMPKMKNGGIRFYDTRRGDLIPLNSTTIEMITKGDMPAPLEEAVEVVEYVMPDSQETMKYAAKAEVVEEKKESDEEKAQRQMNDIIAKSNCAHPKEKSEMYKKDTAKGTRYFPVCTFCGKRERYVKADSLSAEEKLNATVWSD